MVSVIVPSSSSYGGVGFESLGDHLRYNAYHPVVPVRSYPRKRKVIDVSTGNGGPPLIRSGSSASSLYKPLYVDCSVEYELPNVPKVPKNSLPLLVIHPGYEPKKNPSRIGRKRDASSLCPDNIHSSSTPLQNTQTPLYINNSSSSLLSAKRNTNAYLASSCYTGGPSSQGESPAKRSRPSVGGGEWLRHQQQQLKRYHTQHLVSVQQQEHLWRMNNIVPPPLIQQHSSWGGNRCNSSCCNSSNKLWLQQQLYAKQQQQQQQQAYYQQQQQQQQLFRNGGASSCCPDCLSGKCLFVWNKENAYSC